MNDRRDPRGATAPVSGGRGRLLPDFLIVGAPRSGTTSVYEYLNAHPDVFMSPIKEPDFFSQPLLDAVHPLADPLDASLLADSQAHPEMNGALERYLGLFDGATPEQRRGEASAVYLGHPTAAWHLRGYLPEARLIAILRDPTERAYSHYVHGRRLYAEHGRTAAIGADGRSLDEEFARVVDSAYRNGPAESAVSDPEVWIRSGFYFRHLTRWRALFPREQLLVFLFEDLVRDADALTRQILEFLGLATTIALPTTEAFNASVVPRNQGLFGLFTTRNSLMRYARSIAPTRVRGVAMRTRNRLLADAKPPIDPELRRKLKAIYREDTTSLQALVDRDLSTWLEDEPNH